MLQIDNSPTQDWIFFSHIKFEKKRKKKKLHAFVFSSSISHNFHLVFSEKQQEQSTMKLLLSSTSAAAIYLFAVMTSVDGHGFIKSPFSRNYWSNQNGLPSVQCTREEGKPDAE
jgi:hypothetical protein